MTRVRWPAENRPSMTGHTHDVKGAIASGGIAPQVAEISAPSWCSMSCNQRVDQLR
jgi:hypothetical protein